MFSVIKREMHQVGKDCLFSTLSRFRNSFGFILSIIFWRAFKMDVKVNAAREN